MARGTIVSVEPVMGGLAIAHIRDSIDGKMGTYYIQTDTGVKSLVNAFGSIQGAQGEEITYRTASFEPRLILSFRPVQEAEIEAGRAMREDAITESILYDYEEEA